MKKKLYGGRKEGVEGRQGRMRVQAEMEEGEAGRKRG